MLLPFCIRVWDYPNKQKRTRPGRSRIWLFSGSVATLPMLATIAFPPFSVLLSKRFQETKRPPETSVYDYLRNTSLKRKQPAKCQNRFISALRHTFNFHHPTMRLHNLLYKQKPQSMPQVQPFIGAFHIVWLFFQCSDVFLSGYPKSLYQDAGTAGQKIYGSGVEKAAPGGTKNTGFFRGCRRAARCLYLFSPK